MVRLEEVEDESFVDKPESSRDDVLLVDDDADYTDTGMSQRIASITMFPNPARSLEYFFKASHPNPMHSYMHCIIPY